MTPICWLALISLSGTPRALVIGLDGVSSSAMRQAQVPHLRSIGPVQFDVETTKGWRGADTVSGPAWASVLCGLTPSMSGVTGNDVRRRPCQTFLDRVGGLAFAAVPCVRDLSGSEAFVIPAVRRPYADGLDASVVDAAIKAVHGKAPAVFVHLEAVDEAGHNDGWGSPEYLSALEVADAQVGRLLAAARSTGDDWLVIATSDHGGRGQSHNRGWDDPDVSRLSLIHI